MDEQQLQQQVVQLVQAAMQGDQKAQQQIQQIMQAAQQGDQQAAQIAQLIQAVAQQMQQQSQEQQVRAAKFGAKLNYIKQLRGDCPEGYETAYYKAGGRLCKKCMKKAQEGDQLTSVSDQFKASRNKLPMDKCGSKLKKKYLTGGKQQAPQSRYTQTQRRDKYGNIITTRTWNGEPRSVSKIQDEEEGETIYSDHKGRTPVEKQDSLANVYYNGPKKIRK